MSSEKERGGKPKSTNMYVVRGRKAHSQDKKGPQEASDRAARRAEGDRIDELFGFDRFTDGEPRIGWLLNYIPMTMLDDGGRERAGMELYFVDREGRNFKASILYDPYFYIDIDPAHVHNMNEIANHLTRRFEGCRVAIVSKEDLDLPNHLAGVQHKLIKITFDTVAALIETKSEIKAVVDSMTAQKVIVTDDEQCLAPHSLSSSMTDPLACIVGIREYDVPYTMRVAIDLDIRVGAWYLVTPEYGTETCNVEWQKEILELCEPRMLAFDIECEKSPLKFPNAERDRIFMISYMTKGQGYLIINREIVSEDVEDFEYTPKPSFPGPFKVMNVANEEALLRTFVEHVQELRPHIIVTYNGDNFDWPYVENRCARYPRLSLFSNLGIRANKSGGGENADVEYIGRSMVHLDAFSWVQRDSYLPQGNQGLKSVTKCKLGYDPVEVDPEDMVRFAKEKPHHMASYSVSDAVATFYLYTTYVHNFIFSLSTIIPMGPEDVLRKGSGTLCEALLMVEAYKGNIVCPNKQVDPLESFHNGKLLESETYIGGHVECLEAGVFRSDIPVVFSLVPSALQGLIDHVDRDIAFALEVEHGILRSEATNYDEVKQAIVEKLEMLRDSPHREEFPVIYHLDVGAMYPNIILTNRLQPSAMVSTADCAACKYNQSSNNCKRPMTWTWRGEFSPASGSEYNAVKRQLSYEKVPAGNGETKAFVELSAKEQAAMARARLKMYSQRVYKRTKVSQIEERVSTVCMRENSFYVDTVKAFRDRRYDYKLLTKTWKNKKIEAEKKGDKLARKIAEDREVLMDSLQLAHKCILNSFYGYVMRKGARWRSMEMAGIVTHTGAQLIRQARELVEQVGRPLELDTDGIWCILPASFPKEFKISLRNGKSVSLNYPCAMLNADVHDRYTNHQYQVLDQSSGKPKYVTHAECSIFFELDGPYKAMVLPASPEEGRLLKKKYVVFNFDGSLAELKGFEVKRRGELELVKIFQSQVFEQFLAGSNLEECYQAVASVANQWLDVLDSEGRAINDEELLELISERKTISKTIDDYDGRKSTSLTTAGRLADFLGAEMVQDKGLNCNLIISRLPLGAPVTDRALPVAIFSCELSIRRFFLRKWLKDNSLDCVDFRDVVDWNYYKERLGKTIQKIVTIPAGMQRIKNPCPRVEHPSWLQKELNARSQGLKQQSIRDAFSARPGIFASKEEGGVERTGKLPALEARGVKAGKAKRSAEESTDIEDLVMMRAATPNNPAPASSVAAEDTLSKQAATTTTSTATPATAGEGLPAPRPFSTDPPTSTEELQSWLAARKTKWRQVRAMRKMQQTGGGSSQAWLSTLKSKKPAGVADFVRHAHLAAAFGTWQVVEIQEMDTPGEFQVWAFTSPTDLQRLVLQIPRMIYVNVAKHSKDAQLAALDLGGTKVRRDLPHGKDCLELFEVQMSERRFQRNDKSINLFLASTEVEGVYESLVPLWLRAVLKMGCVCKVSTNRKREGLGTQTYQLEDIDMVHTTVHPYLTPANSQYKRIFVYYALDRIRSTNASGILGIFFLQSANKEALNDVISKAQASTDVDSVADSIHAQAVAGSISARCYVWLITGRSVNVLDSKPPFQRIFRKFQPEATAEVKFSATFVTSSVEALKQGNERLEQYYRQRLGPTIVVAQGGNHSKLATLNTSISMGHREWRHCLPALHDFPLTVMPANSLDEQFPAVGWSVFAAERMVQRYILHFRWLQDRLHCASYAQIPLCNLSNDALTVILDVLYARLLHQNRHLLWISGCSQYPDLGQGAAPGQDLWQVWAEPLQEPNVNNPGMYRCACVELDVYGLAVCAIMVSADLDADGLIFNNSSLSGASSSNNNDARSHNGSSMFESDRVEIGTSSVASSEASCGRAFNIFKALVARCVEEVRAGDRLADSILTAVYRYLCGYGNGLLSDPLLHRVIYTLMCRLFWKLMRAFRDLGVSIVFADFSRIIVATNRKTLAEAQEYIDFVLRAVTQKDLFGYLQITTKAFWAQMLWLESENYASLAFEPADPGGELLPASDEPPTADHTDNDVTEGEESQHGGEDDAHSVASQGSHRSGLSFNLAHIKQSTTLDKYRQASYSKSTLSQSAGRRGAEEETASDKDEDSVSSNHSDSEEEGAFVKDRHRRVRSQRKYDSINDLLDSFEEQDPLTDGLSGERGWQGAAKAEEGEGEEDREHDQAGEEDQRLTQKWSLAANWPPAATAYFHYIVGEFLLQYEAVVRQTLVDQTGDATQNFFSVEYTGQLQVVDEEDLVAQATAHIYTYVENTLTPHMLQVVDELVQLHFTSGGEASGGKAHALEFVKATCHILGLESATASAVTAMRRLLLVQLQVPEFSDESAFRLGTDSYILRDVICSYCSMCRDFDLLRDPALLQTAMREAWKCPFCLSALNMEEVETRLVQACDQLTIRFLLQDFRCTQTHAVAQRLCSVQSNVCVKYAMDYSTDRARRDVQLLQRVAQLHGFDYLLQTVQDLLVE